jgi:hypothetical protein
METNEERSLAMDVTIVMALNRIQTYRVLQIVEEDRVEAGALALDDIGRRKMPRSR